METDTRQTCEPLGEVVETSTTAFTAQCHPPRLHAPPEVGTFVRILPPGASPSANGDFIEDPFLEPEERAAQVAAPPETLYAVVVEAYTTGTDPGRKAMAYGLDEESLRAEQPQIFHLLTTEFRAVHLAVQGPNQKLRGGLPAVPPRLHAFVYPCTQAEFYALTELPDLPRRLLFLPEIALPDPLIVACLRKAYAQRGNDFDFLVRMGKQFAVLLRSEADRLNALLRDLEP
ncbi:hypothetical protein [Chthonomonas calidirosea]|uniref:Uncharacterized protein n=1 Tax=Chthonomonas calidirosea (strain DSM 23976 / ICMP 18418 / T49) TaxID=1303518 RepID=S0EZD4_CHTCT|nr:hypothetical protein [Chthonomonas calidirosea]CCW35697.1 hypothetical protein CCALI_01888 [Chthonomonas calidirosea T49]CEK18500.1 hypothetical protein CP488_02206 [Chthonomonas calidirosea]CEK19506.1 hypothetical protein CTKA_02207 [Chthonomonas calidirosea]